MMALFLFSRQDKHCKYFFVNVFVGLVKGTVSGIILYLDLKSATLLFSYKLFSRNQMNEPYCKRAPLVKD